MWLAKRAPVWYWLTECPSVEFIGGFLFFLKSHAASIDENALSMQILGKRHTCGEIRLSLSQMNRKFDFSAKTNLRTLNTRTCGAGLCPWHISRNLRILCSFLEPKSISHLKGRMSRRVCSMSKRLCQAWRYELTLPNETVCRVGKNEEMHHLRSYMHKWKNWEFFLVYLKPLNSPVSPIL